MKVYLNAEKSIRIPTSQTTDVNAGFQNCKIKKTMH